MFISQPIPPGVLMEIDWLILLHYPLPKYDRRALTHVQFAPRILCTKTAYEIIASEDARDAHHSALRK